MLKQSIFAVALLAGSGVAAAQEWGDLDGTFVLKGAVPAEKKITPTKDPEFCGKHAIVEETLVVNKDNKGIANVFIYLADATKPKIHPDYDKPELAKAEIALDNKDCRFSPHVLGIRTGQTLLVGNKDAVGHNTKADFFNNTPFNDLIPAGGSIKKSFAKPETQPSPISCSIHPWMNSYLLIREDPYFAVSDADGKFSIKNLPAGEHTFVVWNGKYVSSVTVDGKAATWQRGRVKVNIKSGQTSLGKVEVAADPAAK